MLQFRPWGGFFEDYLTMSAFGLMHYLPREHFFAPFLRRVAAMNPGWECHIDEGSIATAKLEGWPWRPIPHEVRERFMPMPSATHRDHVVPDVLIRSPGRFILYVEAELSKDVEPEQLLQQLVVATSEASHGERPLVLLLNGTRDRPLWAKVSTSTVATYVKDTPMNDTMPLESYIDGRLRFVREAAAPWCERLPVGVDGARSQLGWLSWSHVGQLAGEQSRAGLDTLASDLLKELATLFAEKGFSGISPPPRDYGVGPGISLSAVGWISTCQDSTKPSNAAVRETPRANDFATLAAAPIGDDALGWATEARRAR